MLFREAEVVYRTRRVQHQRRIMHASDAVKLFQEAGLANKVTEHFMVMWLNTRHDCLAVETVSKGGVSETLVDPRAVFRGALMAGAVAIILGHNHPSGDSDPSPEDVVVTKRLRECGDILGIKVLDHMILGSEDYVSLAETGRM